MSREMIFAKAMEEELNDEKSITENGAVGYKTTKSALVDFHFKGSSYRDEDEQTIQSEFGEAYNENPLLAIKLLFLTGDIRQGMGERKTFRACMKWLATYHTDKARKVLSLIPEYSRWDIVVDMLGTPIDKEAFNLIDTQLQNDRANMRVGEPISLLAKWLPSVNTSSNDTRAKAREIRTRMTEKTYRKLLSSMRSYLNVVETKMSAGEWGKIEYQSVPSMANLLYKEAFMKHDETRRTKYLEALEKGEAKINSGVSFPCDIVHEYRWETNIDTTLEQMWKSLPDYVQGHGNNVLCVVDGSNSMNQTIGGTSLTSADVAKSLGIYFAEKMPGQFHNKYITFSERPQLVDFNNCDTLFAKLEEARRHTEAQNTNIYRVFKLVLDTAKRYNMSQDEMPKSILIASDLEFDCQTDIQVDGIPYNYNRNQQLEVLFKAIDKEYRANGYKLPKLVFWAIDPRTKTVPMQENENGLVLIGGFSVALASMVFSEKLTPYDVLVEKLSSKRYEPVEKALA